MPYSVRYSTSRGVGIREPYLRARVDGLCSAIARAIVLFGLLSLFGCISTQKIEQPPSVLRDAIRNGEVVEPGQHVSIVTTSRGELEFRVAEVDRNAIRGKDVEVPIEDVVALQIRSVDVLATASLAAGWYVLTGVAVYLALVLTY